MAVETSVILRSILLAAMRAKSAREVAKIVEAMCSKEDIDAVKEALRELEEMEEE